MLLIIDARFRSVALANRVKGGGYEYSEYYTNCEIQFMNLENIHVIRSSFQSLRGLCQTIIDNKTFLSQLEATKWLHHLSGIIKAACTVTAAVDQLGKPVLVHCSDGWDRTPQILGLAKLLLDPYYRTIDGLRTLIEIEWLAFGHKFAQRNGHANNYNDINERCPVFLQWLDCVFQITRQFPSAFQFNELCLLKLCYHAYSCLFGTFLCDSAIERAQQHTDERTFSVWSYLNERNREIVNQLYDDTYEKVNINYFLINKLHF
jgi:myotubularin-related protein 3/4